MGINTTSGAAFPRFLASKVMAKFVGAEIREKIENPLKFLGGAGGAEQPPKPVYGFDAPKRKRPPTEAASVLYLNWRRTTRSLWIDLLKT